MMNEVLTNVMEQPVPQNGRCTVPCLSCTATCCTIQVAETIHNCNGYNCMARLAIILGITLSLVIYFIEDND